MQIKKQYRLNRFLKRQEKIYRIALNELIAGQKKGHWMWFILPQLRGLARSRAAFVYGIENIDEAKAYLAHPILGPRLIDCFTAILSHKGRNIEDIMGDADAVKLRSCATLFSEISKEDSVFHKVLAEFYDGRADNFTLCIISGKIIDATHLKFMAPFVS